MYIVPLHKRAVLANRSFALFFESLSCLSRDLIFGSPDLLLFSWLNCLFTSVVCLLSGVWDPSPESCGRQHHAQHCLW
jgi:hypothetical protein